MKAAIFGLIAAAALSACAAPTSAPPADPAAQVNPAVARALNSAPDGYRAVTSTGQPFEIVSTAVSDNRLCRVVSFEKPGSFVVDSYCKARGGTWR